MIRLNFGNDAEIIRLPYPTEWDPALLTGLTLTINDQDGNELAAADAATLYTETSLDADAHRYAREIVLDSEAEDLAIGDFIRIQGVLGYEDHTVKGYDATNLTAELEEYLDRDFEAGATVNLLSAFNEVDLSNTTTFPAGKELLLIWIPTGCGGPITKEAMISAYRQIDLAGLNEMMQDIYPRAYKALKDPRDRLERVAARAVSDIRKRLLIMDDQFEINNIRGMDALLPVVAAQCAVLWTLNGDDDLSEERKTYKAEVDTEIELLAKDDTLWVDVDADGVDDPLEKRAHPHIFHTGW